MTRILIADDDPAIVDSLTMLLEDEGYAVEATTNGHTVTDSRQAMPDLILLDIWMSGISGNEICRKLRDVPLTKAIPVIMMSANRDTATIARDAGADDFISKPFDVDALLDKIKRALGHDGVKRQEHTED